MFAHFSLPDVESVSRRTVFTSLALGVAGLVVAVVTGWALGGLGLCIGVGLGIFNFRMVQNSVAKVGASEHEHTRRPLALNTMFRLGIITVVTLGLLFWSWELGFGVLVGLGCFQFLLLANVARSMFNMGGHGDPLGDDGVDGGSPGPTSADLTGGPRQGGEPA